jgi:hypothetical protein
MRHVILGVTYVVLAPLLWLLDQVGLTRFLLGRRRRSGRWHPEALAESFRGYRATKHDVFVCVYFKSGTNWALQIAHQIATRGRQEFEHIRDVIPWPDDVRDDYIELRDESVLRDSPTGLRVIKTHLAWEYVPQHPAARYISVVRDPKDVFVSIYRFTRSVALGPLMPSVATWLDFFLSRQFYMGSWTVHTHGYWAERHRPNVLLLTFKEMKDDLPEAVRRIADFMGVTLTPDEFERVCHRSTFEYMRSIDHKFRPARTTPFTSGRGTMMRRGQHGASCELLSRVQQQRIDDHFTAELKKLGSDFPYGDETRIETMSHPAP